MILAVSRFRVANGMEAQVKEAFLNRPHQVDSVPAFLGMETFTDSQDPTVFYLITRWTDAGSFHAWHFSKEHRLSHRFIPKGLKLDPKFTKLLVLERLSDSERFPDFEETVADSVSVIARSLNTSPVLTYIVASLEGCILACNESFALQLRKNLDEVRGQKLWDFLTDTDTMLVKREIADRERGAEGRILLNFVDDQSHPFTIECQLEVRPDAFTIVGAPPLRHEQALSDGMLSLNNELAVLMRENTRQSKLLKKAYAELERTHAELRESHWHLRKIQEVLPICLLCKKVKTGDGQWDELVKFVTDNSDFLSHSYCPECGAKMMAELAELKRKRAEGSEYGRSI